MGVVFVSEATYCNFGPVGELTPDGTVFVDCGGSKTFTCKAGGIPLKWTIDGLRGINIVDPFLARKEACEYVCGRITTNATGHKTQEDVSFFTISGFTVSHKGGIIQCINADDHMTIGMATISICECVCCVHNTV